ncbi:hypothetical protein, partial [Methanocalculus sp. MSAO_Arc1]|uniref:hypothetical protein n=1 Tax=Methanocalculus sp. MSAO_Arc1 TaxID=2293854 RepID=UPI0025FFA27B
RTEVISPCSKEQSVRTIRRIGAYLLWLPPEYSRPSRASICGNPAQTPLRSICGRVRGGGGLI